MTDEDKMFVIKGLVEAYEKGLFTAREALTSIIPFTTRVRGDDD